MSATLPRCLALACILLALFCNSCGGRVITEQSFAGRCIMYSPGNVDDGGSCGPQPQICDQFKRVVYDDYASRQECIQACTQMQSQLYQQYLVGACRDAVRYAWQNCNNYCRANYQ